MQLRRAQKSIAKLRIGLAGPSGAGKTYSALLLANGLAPWDKIAVIDTENMSADLYSDLGAYNVYTLEAPFSPDRYVAAIKECEAAGMDVIIIDSITHEWSGTGGCLQIQEKLGGRFQDWAKVTPMHEKFKNALLQSKAHIVTTVRSKTDYMMSDEGGKNKVQKVGLKQETREGFEYELTLSFDINIKHLAEASKDRTGLFADGDPVVISQETGKKLLDWANTGLDPVKLAREIEGLMVKKGVSLDNTLAHYKIDDLAELPYPKLLAIKDKLDGMPDKKNTPPAAPSPQQPPQSEPIAPQTAKSEEIVDIDEVADAIDKKSAEVAPDAPKSAPEDDDPIMTATAGQDAPVMASAGDLKLLEALMQRRAKQAKKGFETMRDALLKKLGLETMEGLTKDQAKKLIDQVSKLNTEYDMANREQKDKLVSDAEEVFGVTAN